MMDILCIFLYCVCVSFIVFYAWSVEMMPVARILIYNFLSAKWIFLFIAASWIDVASGRIWTFLSMASLLVFRIMLSTLKCWRLTDSGKFLTWLMSSKRIQRSLKNGSIRLFQENGSKLFIFLQQQFLPKNRCKSWV